MNRPRSLRASLASALTLLLMLGLTVPVSAQDERPDREPPDPQAVADGAIKRMEGLADRCDQRVTRIADATVEKLDELDPEAAVRLARHNKAAINRTAARCARGVREINRSAMIVLRRLDAPELAEVVHAAAKDAIADIRASREAAVTKINDKLDELGLDNSDGPTTGA